MKVVLKTNLSGPENVHGYPGDVVEVDEETGQRLIASGQATLADPDAVPRPQ